MSTTGSASHAAARAGPGGRIRAAVNLHHVTFEPALDALARRIDDAYRTKYAHSPYLAPMVSDRARAASFHIVPRRA